MTIYLGKRQPGSLTKAAPGDTLYIPFATYNDSGASVVDTGFNHADVEIYKNNETTARATDSGVWLGDSGLNYEIGGTRVAASALSDTGLYGNVAGIYTIGIRLFNTSDDTGFYDAGSTYHVTVQGLSVRTGQGMAEVNFVPAMFEIDGKRVQAGAYVNQGSQGFPRVDLRAVLADTGAANLDQGRLGVISDSGRMAAVLDTGKVAAAVWTSHATRALTSFQFDTGVWGSNAARTLTAFQFDTGVWGSNAARTLTAFQFDTGVAQTVWRESSSTYTGDTGSVGYAQGRLMAVKGDTGAAHLDQGRLGVLADSGVLAAVLDTGKVAGAVWTSHATRTLTAFAFDTGVAQTVWRESSSTYTGDTGSVGYAQGRLMAVKGDTGAAHLDAGRLGVSATATVDTGVIHDAVWNVAAGNSLRTLTNLDTGNLIHLAQMADEYDTGRLPAEATATLDTGAVHDAVWNVAAGNSLRTLTNLDTGNLIHLAQMADEYDTGRLPAEASATLDTGAVHDAVWNVAAGDGTRALTAFAFDTGVADTVWRAQLSSFSDTGSMGRVADLGGGAIVDTTVAGVPTSTTIPLTAGSAVDNFYVDQLVFITSGTGSGQVRVVDAYNGTTKVITVDEAFATTPAAGDRVTVVRSHVHSITSIADTVWDELDTGHSDTGTFGRLRQGVNLNKIDGDTGPADNLGRIAGDTGSDSYLYKEVDTGRIAVAVWAKDVRTLTAFQFDTGVWGSNAARTLTAFQFDTGVADTVWKSSTSSFTADTGSVGYAQGRLMAVKGDTGAAHLDAGRLGVNATISLDTGVVHDAVWNVAAGDSTRALTTFAFDTGVAQTVWRESPSTYTGDTGSAGYAQGRLMAVKGDTGAAHLDQGRLGVIADSGVLAAVLDTGKVAGAVWTSHATRTLTAFSHDTGVAQTVWRESTSTYTADTGSVAYAQGRLMAVRTDTGAAHLDQGRLGVRADSGVLAAVIDTGKVSNAVWNTLQANHTVSGSFGRNVADSGKVAAVIDTGKASTAIWTSSVSSYTADTGGLGYAQGRLLAVKGDTGAAHLDQGRLGVRADSGVLAAVLDTGKVASAVWTSHATRALTAFAHDTGVADTVWKSSGSTYTDTGSLGKRIDKLQFDTGANELQADIRKVANVQVKGAGDTGTGDTWRPVTEV